MNSKHRTARDAATKCLLADIFFIAAVAWGGFFLLDKNALAFAGCWLSAIACIVAAVYYGKKTNRLMDMELRDLLAVRHLGHDQRNKHQ